MPMLNRSGRSLSAALLQVVAGATIVVCCTAGVLLLAGERDDGVRADRGPGTIQSLTLLEDTYFPDLESEDVPRDPGKAKYRDEILMFSTSDVSPKSYLVAMTLDTGPIIAAGTEVISGTLDLSTKYCVKDELPIALGLVLYLIDEPWDSTSITGEFVPKHRELVASMELLDPSPEAAIWDSKVQIDISRAIEAWQRGTANHGIMLKLYGGGLSHATCVFSSLESNQPPRAQVAMMRRSRIMLPFMVIGQLDWPR